MYWQCVAVVVVFHGLVGVLVTSAKQYVSKNLLFYVRETIIFMRKGLLKRPSKNRVEEERPKAENRNFQEPKSIEMLNEIAVCWPTAIYTCNSNVKVEAGRASAENTLCS